MSQDKVAMMVGTKKGAFVFTSEGRRAWKPTGPYFRGEEIYHMAYDRRSGTFLASVISGHWGPTIASRKGLEGEWEVTKTPPKFGKASGLTVARVWQIRPGPDDQPGVVYAGVED
ncbi:MAG: exo-alpha-sialidase, partial [Nitrososphaerota archaeon]|nr:exo-alpha-sialidase [Nitrososphaerota archaeon]